MQQRHALGLLFLALGLGFVLVAVAAAAAGQWVIGAAALVLGAWLGLTASQSLRRRKHS